MKVLALNGSLRRNSWNRKLLNLAVDELERKGIEVEQFDLKPLPIYDADLEAKETPSPARELQEAIQEADAVIITSPEYNGSMSSAAKNAVEWASRPPNVLREKPFFIMGASGGRSGAARMHMHLSYALESEGAYVIHQPRVLLPHIANLITPEGELIDESVGTLLEQAMGKVIEFTERISVRD